MIVLLNDTWGALISLSFFYVPPLTLLGNCSCLLVFLNYADKKQKKLGALFIRSLILQIQVH